MIIYYGAVLNPKTLENYDILPRCLLIVGDDGNVQWIKNDIKEHEVQDVLTENGFKDVEVVVMPNGEFLIPGFVDTHTHAPQFLSMGSGGQDELLAWLHNTVYPAENKVKDNHLALRAYKKVVRNIINLGTTTCCYYGSLHWEATSILADIVHEFGQRAFVGKCNMNREATEYYVEPSVDVSIANTHKLIDHIRALPQITPPLVKPILTPRFAVACTNKLLDELKKIADSDHGLNIQTHIAENREEVRRIKEELFPELPNYASVYDHYHLLRHNTVLGHAVHLEEGEIQLIADKKAGIAHCPISNFNLTSGVAPVGKYLDHGIKVGLGTDVSGGFSPSMLRVVQEASIAAKLLAYQAEVEGRPHSGTFTDKKLKIATLFFLATLGGAQVCDIDQHVGSFAPGKAFDALHVNLRDGNGNPGIWSDDIGDLFDDELKTSEDVLKILLERFLFCGDDRNLRRVYVQGRLIGGTEFPHHK
ncbi:hypothetical protein AMATHDRAFT_40007 [Amanita thiersii Skay4041]|uniref:Probable guanine deaminase n=1 Tax=Amanita thiersii Skay4041 TaxID=703135 RepID=A0A2A9NVP0_9AGAR|nr:hypothetical protein AMATHDRAFT_40007 [Amanita thiersii Skay4041]